VRHRVSHVVAGRRQGVRMVTASNFGGCTLSERIAAASAELKLARRDGSAEWITKSAEALDALIDQLPIPSLDNE